MVINHPHTPELADKVVADIEGGGGAALAVAADISSQAEYRDMVDRLLAARGRWDVLVNNAAGAITKPFAQVTEAEFDLSFAVNVRGVVHGLQLACQHLAGAGRHHHLQLALMPRVLNRTRAPDVSSAAR